MSMWANLAIRQKALLVFMIAALVPLVLINILWLRSSQGQLRQAAANQQSLLVSSSASRISEFLETKLTAAISHSQVQSVIDINTSEASLNLIQYANLDSDAIRIALVDTTGNERVVIKNHGLESSLKNIMGTEAFRVVSFRSNEASVSKIFFDNGQPRVTMSVPLLGYSRLGATTLTGAQALARRGGADTKGVLVVDVSLSGIWQSVLSTKLGNEGYVYIVDDKGSLLAHHDQKFLQSHKEVRGTDEVKKSINTIVQTADDTAMAGYKPVPHVSVSETGQQVLSSHQPIKRTRWSVIGEEPIASVYSAATNAKRAAVVIFVTSLGLAGALVFLATRSVVRPINQLTREAVRMGEGNFSEQLVITGKDELSILAQTFNKMGLNLQNLLNEYREQNIVLLAEQTKLQAVLDTIADGVIVLNHDYKITLVNKMIATLGGYPNAQKLQGKPWLEAFNMYHKGLPFSNRLLQGRSLMFNDVELRLADKQKYTNLMGVRLSDDPNGIAYIITVHDTTQSRELENMRLDFVSMAAHELRTPLTAIRGYLGLMNSGSASNKEGYVKRAEASADNLSSLINNMLSLSRIERHAMRFNMAELNWQQAVQAEIDNQVFSAEARKLVLKFKPPDKPMQVFGDKLALGEVLGNLIANAIHYTKEGGTITVSLETTQAGVKTIVSDTGIGIPGDSMDKLFTKYFRVESGLTANSQGTGIGLFICKSIVEAHGGEIGVSSEPDKGSSFFFTLPNVATGASRQVMSDSDTMATGTKLD